ETSYTTRFREGQPSVGTEWAEGQPPCCIDVTKNNVSPEVVGEIYREQAARPPCVKAIIFNTKNGLLCADPDAQWVKDRKLPPLHLFFLQSLVR
uniref:Chemokine interleukin-8-like domain-containing protein n=1 Tax=Oreochromis aureus TaxID=47969 RepID=A0A668SQ79_OREAU